MAKVPEADHHKVFQAEQSGRVLIVVPRGDVAGFRESDFSDELNRLLGLIDGERFNQVLVDFSAGRYFGSRVIGAATALDRKAEEVGGRLAICGASDDMVGVLGAMQLLERWPQFDSRRGGLKSLLK